MFCFGPPFSVAKKQEGKAQQKGVAITSEMLSRTVELLKSWLLEALWQGIYKCSISVNLLPYSILCSFNGQISLRFLLNLSGKRIYVCGYDQALPGERSVGEECPLSRDAFFPWDAALNVTSCLNITSLLGLTFKCNPLSWKEEDIQNNPNEKEYRMHLVIFGQRRTSFDIEDGKEIKGQLLQAFHFSDG